MATASGPGIQEDQGRDPDRARRAARRLAPGPFRERARNATDRLLPGRVHRAIVDRVPGRSAIPPSTAGFAEPRSLSGAALASRPTASSIACERLEKSSISS